MRPWACIVSGTIRTTSISCWRLPRWRATGPPSSRRPRSCAASSPTRSRAASRWFSQSRRRLTLPMRCSALPPPFWRSPIPATAFRTSKPCGTTGAALLTRRRAILPPPRRKRMRSRPSRAGISRCSNPRTFRRRTCWRWRALFIEARIAQRQGDKVAAIERFERAAALQDGLPYMEPPYWYYPVRQSLAVALMQAGRLDEAEEQFQRALKRAPSNGWSWYGLAELYRARGKADQASKLEAD